MRLPALAALLVGAFVLGAGEARAAVRVDVVHENPSFVTLAVDRDGMAYGKSIILDDPTARYRLYRSSDEGRTWTPVFDFPIGSDIVSIAVLSTGTLIATVNNGPAFLFRSGDGGRSWTQTLEFDVAGLNQIYTTLTPHSITDDGTYAYVGSYNTLDTSTHRSWVWRSADDGRTWSVIRETDTHRHIHFVQVNPYTGDLYVGYGDESPQAAIERSRDHGVTWQVVCSGNPCLAVDIVFAKEGFALFGTDAPFLPGSVQRLDLATGIVSSVSPQPGTSFSAFALDGVFLIGTTHEPSGLYPSGDTDVHLLGSDDGGSTFKDVFKRPYINRDIYMKLIVQYAYPNGDFPIQITGYYGTIVGRIAHSPRNQALPAIAGAPAVGAASTVEPGSWDDNPTGFEYVWQRCTSSGTGCGAIRGATSQTYTPEAADLGSTLRVLVTASNDVGGTAVMSAPAAVLPAPPQNVALPAVAGAPRQGGFLTASTGTWTGGPTAFEFGWQRCDTGGMGCVPIPDAASATFVPGATEVGSTVRARVVASSAGGATAALSAATGVVAAPLTPARPAASAPATPSGGGGAGGASAAGATTSPDLALYVTAAPSTARVGELLTYALTVTDVNGAPANNVVLRAALPASVAVQSTSADHGGRCSGTADLVCNLDPLSANAPLARLSVTVLLERPGPAVATFAVAADVADLHPADNEATVPHVTADRSTAAPGSVALGLRSLGGDVRTPLRASPRGNATVVSGAVAVAGATRLEIAATGRAGGRLPLLSGSRLGSARDVLPERTIVYRHSGTSRIEFSLRIPLRVLPHGTGGLVHVRAWDAAGRSAQIGIPFRRA